MIDKNLVKAFVLEYKQKQKCEKIWNTNHIKLETYFKYSGETEEDTEEWKEYKEAQKYANIKAAAKKSCRKEYFKKYWLKYKLK